MSKIDKYKHKHFLRKGSGVSFSKVLTTSGAKIWDATLVYKYNMLFSVIVADELWHDEKGNHYLAIKENVLFIMNFAFKIHNKEER